MSVLGFDLLTLYLGLVLILFAICIFLVLTVSYDSHGFYNLHTNTQTHTLVHLLIATQDKG